MQYSPTPPVRSAHQHTSSLGSVRSNGTPTRPKLRQTSSIADLKQSFSHTITSKFRRRFGNNRSEEDDFECRGDQLEISEADERASDSREQELLPAYMPPPPRPEPVPLDQSCWTKEQIRNIERAKEERAAEEALAAYFAGLSTMCNRSGADTGTPRSSLQSATSSSSRPRTNDSLPSYHSSLCSPRAEAPSLAQFSATNSRRPSLTPHLSSESSPPSDAASNSPRMYAYI